MELVMHTAAGKCNFKSQTALTHPLDSGHLIVVMDCHSHPQAIQINPRYNVIDIETSCYLSLIFIHSTPILKKSCPILKIVSHPYKASNLKIDLPKALTFAEAGTIGLPFTFTIELLATVFKFNKLILELFSIDVIESWQV